MFKIIHCIKKSAQRELYNWAFILKGFMFIPVMVLSTFIHVCLGESRLCVEARKGCESLRWLGAGVTGGGELFSMGVETTPRSSERAGRACEHWAVSPGFSPVPALLSSKRPCKPVLAPDSAHCRIWLWFVQDSVHSGFYTELKKKYWGVRAGEWCGPNYVLMWSLWLPYWKNLVGKQRQGQGTQLHESGNAGWKECLG